MGKKSVHESKCSEYDPTTNKGQQWWWANREYENREKGERTESTYASLSLASMWQHGREKETMYSIV